MLESLKAGGDGPCETTLFHLEEEEFPELCGARGPHREDGWHDLDKLAAVRDGAVTAQVPAVKAAGSAAGRPQQQVTKQIPRTCMRARARARARATGKQILCALCDPLGMVSACRARFQGVPMGRHRRVGAPAALAHLHSPRVRRIRASVCAYTRKIKTRAGVGLR